MAIFNLTPPAGATTGGTWAIAGVNTCGAVLSSAGVLEIIVPDVDPAVSCEVVASYTVANGTCSDVSVHQITVSLKSCISFSNSATSDWELHLNPLTIDNTIVTDPFVYAVVPVDALCGVYTGAVAWGYKGNCGYTPPSDLTPKANFATSNDEQTFQVPAGNYKVVVVCVGNTVLSDCEKIDCCEYEITVTDLDLCSATSNCTTKYFSYVSSQDFTIYIPILTTIDKCMRLEFNGGTTFVDKVELEVNIGTAAVPIWSPIKLGLTNDYVNINNVTSIVVSSTTTPPSIPHMPYINGATPVVVNPNKYQFRWIISRASIGNNNTTEWSADLSCCDCLLVCPVKKYTCINSIVENPTPLCSNNCSNITVNGTYGYSVDEILSYIGGVCVGNGTCIGKSKAGGGSTLEVYCTECASSSNPSFVRYFGRDSTTTNIVTGTPCPSAPLSKILLDAPITVYATAHTYIITFGIGNIAKYNSLKTIIDTLLLGDLSNKYLSIPTMYNYGLDGNGDPILDCGDTNDIAGNPPSLYLAQNNSRVTVGYDDSTGTITFMNVNPDEVSSCVNLSDTITTKPEIFVCNGYTTDIFNETGIMMQNLGDNHIISIGEIYVKEYIPLTNGENFSLTTCNTLYENNRLVILDVLSPATTWLLYDRTIIQNYNCNGIIKSAYLVLQYGSGLNPSVTYPIPNYTALTGTCTGWLHNNIYYLVIPGQTGVGFNDCYNPI